MDQATPRSPPDRSLDHLLPPTPRQRNAIYALNPSGSPENDRKVLDWLELTRSFWKKFGEDSDFGCPSYKEAVALFTLASYDDENIREWLRQSHAPVSSNNSRCSPSTPASSLPSSSRSSRKYARVSSDSTTSGSSAYSFNVKHFPYSQSTYHPEVVAEEENFRNDIHTQSHMTCTPDERPLGASPPIAAGGKEYRCSTGEHLPKARSATIANFRRHEKEHVDRYDCFSRQTDFEEVTPSGRRCIICRVLNPDVAHFSEHRLETCVKRGKPLTFTRLDVFKSHLKTEHGFSSDTIKKLVKSRYYQIEKTAFACGFCVGVLFDSKEKHVAHIVEAHFKQGQDMKDWDENKMMRSILRHPEINPAWNRALTSNPTISEQLLSWPETIRGHVSLEVDLGSTSAESFVSTALEHAVEGDCYVHRDDTRNPLPLMSGATDSSPSGQESPFSCLPTLTTQIGGIGSFIGLPTSTEPFGHEISSMDDEPAMLPSTLNLGSPEPSRSPTFPPLRFDSLPQAGSHTIDNTTTDDFDYMQSDQLGPGTISPTQYSRKEIVTQNQSPPERWSFGQLHDNGYTENSMNRQSNPDSNCSEANVAAELNAHLQQTHEYVRLLDKKDFPTPKKHDNPTSAPVKRKVSANEVKSDGAEWYSWADL